MRTHNNKIARFTPRLLTALSVALAVLSPFGAATASAGSALVIYESLRVSEINASNALAAMLTARGLTPDVRDVSSFFPTDPGDLSGFQCVWDLRVDGGLFPVEDSRYGSFVQGGGGIFLAGEHGVFVARNSSIAAFISGLGGGPVAITTVPPTGSTPADFFEPVNPAHAIAGGCGNPVSLIDYDGIGYGTFLNFGNGLWLTGFPSVGGAAVWDPGTLSLAPTGKAVLVLDSNFMATGTTGTLDFQTDGVTPTQNRPFVENMLTYLCGFQFTGCDCAPRNHGYWHRYCLGTGTIDPGRNGQGNGPGPTHDSSGFPANLPALVDGDMAAYGVGGCAALDDGPFSDKRLAALRELATLNFDLRVGYLTRGCAIELRPMVDTPGLTVGDGLSLIQADLASGSDAALEEARWIGEHIANGEALTR